MNKFYSKNERKVLEFYKKELDSDFRILPYDMNNPKDLKDYLDLALMSFMDFKKYWSVSNDLIEELDETLERYDPLTWVSLFDEEIHGDQKILETIDALSEAQTNMSELFSGIESKLRQIIENIMHKDESIQGLILGRYYVFSEDHLDNCMEDLLEADFVDNLKEAYDMFFEALDLNFESKNIPKETSDIAISMDLNEPLCLHLELVHENMSDHERHILHKYGKTNKDGIISRDVLVPRDIMLHQIHYMIQRLFGWRDSHLRKFTLAQKDFERLTENSFKKWTPLSGLLFKSLGDVINFYDEDYEGGNAKEYLRKKYTGPYFPYHRKEFYNVSQENVDIFRRNFPMVQIRESFSEYMERVEREGTKGKSSVKIIKTIPPMEMTIDEMRQAFMEDAIYDELLESLPLKAVLGHQEDLKGYDELISKALDFEGPFTDELYYAYDFGDGWVVKMTLVKDYVTIINDVSTEVISKAVMDVKKEHRPICLQSTGLNVADDVGGIYGYVNFLEIMNTSTDEEEIENMKLWSKSMGWTNRKTAPKNML